MYGQRNKHLLFVCKHCEQLQLEYFANCGRDDQRHRHHGNRDLEFRFQRYGYC